MKVTTFEATVENGIIKLPEHVQLPEKTRVYVVIPGVDVQPAYYARSPRLVHPEQAADFVKEVIEEHKNAGLR
ncbi:MAG: hypothetical protein A2V86_10225 [Deltaproteobacteria bacterium RBG_16_49_23]|nr:MAG: hypothetical protein A2V86_10225 [Deltaproteobacteria bacterium RBG_16_49_23]